MKKILAILMASAVIFAASSCGNKDNTDDLKDNEVVENGNKSEAENGTATDKQEINIGDGSNTGAVKAITADYFTEIIGYSMAPYKKALEENTNMVSAVSGFNGKVELTYYAFGTTEDAVAYYNRLAELCPGEIVSNGGGDNYALCKKQDGVEAYMMVRIDETILFGWGKNGDEELTDWFYGLGYVDEK